MWQELLLRQRHYSVSCSLSIVPFICKEAQKLSGLLDSVFFLTDCDLFMETQIVKSALLNFPIVASLEILVFILEVSKWVAFMWDANQDIHDTPFWDRSLLHSSCWPQTLDPPALFIYQCEITCVYHYVWLNYTWFLLSIDFPRSVHRVHVCRSVFCQLDTS